MTFTADDFISLDNDREISTPHRLFGIQVPNLRRFWLRRFTQRPTVFETLRKLGVDVADDAKFYGAPIVSMAPDSRVSIGAAAILTSESEFTALGVSRPCILRTLRRGAIISIGAESGLSGTVVCAAQSVTIGRECLMGADVLIADTDFHPLKAKNRRHSDIVEDIATASVVIEDNVFIGARSMVLKGVRIGMNSVIGAGSVVVSDIPANVIAAGVPARVLRPLPE